MRDDCDGEEQRNFLLLEYHKCQGKQDFYPSLFKDYQLRFPGSRVPSKPTIRELIKKQTLKGTVLKCNKASSPGNSHSGQRTTVNTPVNRASAKLCWIGTKTTFWEMPLCLLSVQPERISWDLANPPTTGSQRGSNIIPTSPSACTI